MSEPIWKDRFVSLGAYATNNFRIKVGNNTIYNGKAYRRPGATQNTIKINDICADYLQNVIPSMTHAEFTALGEITFKTESYYSNAWHEVDSVEFINDWSYDYNYNPETDGMSFPIINRVDGRQWLIYTAYNSDIVEAKLNLTNGESVKVYVSTLVMNDFNIDYNEDFAKALRGSKNGTALIDLSQYDVVSVEINGNLYEVVSSCNNRYALYYSNAHGGWDSLLIEGNTQIQDSLKRHSRELDYDNRDITNRGTDNYLNEVERKMTLHTSWLTDEESMRMHHLLNSTSVFLLDMDTQQMIPVVLDNTTTEHKTYKSNGRQMVNYTIELTIAHTMIRR